ncbi:MAG: hypothetical protein FADNKDHG_01473 [Holosporales bacterium]
MKTPPLKKYALLFSIGLDTDIFIGTMREFHSYVCDLSFIVIVNDVLEL